MILDILQIIVFSYDVTKPFDSKNKNNDGEDDDMMMLITGIHHTLRSVGRCAYWKVQGGCFHYVRRDLSLDLEEYVLD